MFLNKKVLVIASLGLCIIYAGCKVPSVTNSPALKDIPISYTTSTDTTSIADVNWKEYFKDSILIALIDTAIHNNPDVPIALQQIEIASNRVRARNSELYPSVTAGGAAGLEKVGRYTSQGAGDASADITPGKTVPEHLPDMMLGLRTSWEVDIWGKLKSAKKSAYAKYLQSIEGKNFVITNLVAEVANTYYELLALDNQLEIIRQNIKLQQKQLEILKAQKEAALVTELAVKQFEAQVLNSQSLEFDVLQKIAENENQLNFLLGRFPQKIIRSKESFDVGISSAIKTGIPSQLLKNRPDIKQAELELLAAKWDVKVAKMAFYPSLNISATLGVQAFSPSYLFKLPESLLYSVAADLAGPIINRNAIMAEYRSANSYQIQSMFEYQKSILNGYVEVTTELSNINNLEKMHEVKAKEVEVLNRSVSIATDLYKAARANYLEVLTAQRDALSSTLELIEVKKQQLMAMTKVYRALGGGWKAN